MSILSPNVYFHAGVIGIFWVAAFMYFVYEEPDSHPRISEEESIYLQRTIIKTKHIMPVCITVITILLKNKSLIISLTTCFNSSKVFCIYYFL